MKLENKAYIPQNQKKILHNKLVSLLNGNVTKVDLTDMQKTHEVRLELINDFIHAVQLFIRCLRIAVISNPEQLISKLMALL